MVTLDFQVIDKVLQDDLEAGLTDMAALLETYFVMPIRFSIGNAELFETISPQSNYFQADSFGNTKIVEKKLDHSLTTPWLNLPVLGFGIDCFQKLIKACNGSISVYQLPGGIGYINFERVNDELNISCTYNGVTAASNCLDLTEAFTVFRERARHLAENTFPELGKDPIWKILIE